MSTGPSKATIVESLVVKGDPYGCLHVKGHCQSADVSMFVPSVGPAVSLFRVMFGHRSHFMLPPSSSTVLGSDLLNKTRVHHALYIHPYHVLHIAVSGVAKFMHRRIRNARIKIRSWWGYFLFFCGETLPADHYTLFTTDPSIRTRRERGRR